jgi:hypothetical protein
VGGGNVPDPDPHARITHEGLGTGVEGEGVRALVLATVEAIDPVEGHTGALAVSAFGVGGGLHDSEGLLAVGAGGHGILLSEASKWT